MLQEGKEEPIRRRCEKTGPDQGKRRGSEAEVEAVEFLGRLDLPFGSVTSKAPGAQTNTHKRRNANPYIYV